MKQAKIIIATLEDKSFKKKDSEEVVDLTSITYLIQMSNNEKTKGYAILECYSNGNAFTMLESYIGKVCTADIEERVIDKQIKYYIVAIDGKKIK